MSIYIQKKSLQFVQSVPETKDEKSVENTDSSDDKKQTYYQEVIYELSTNKLMIQKNG